MSVPQSVNCAESEFARAALRELAQRSGDYAEVSVPSGLRHGLIAAELWRSRVCFQIWARSGETVLGVKRDTRVRRAILRHEQASTTSRSRA